MENFEQKNNDRIMKKREEMENKLNSILKEIKFSKSASTVTNPRSETNGTQNKLPSGSNIDKSIGVHTSCNENSKMKDRRHPSKPLHRREIKLDATIISEEDSEEEDYHKCSHTKGFFSTAFCSLLDLQIFLTAEFSEKLED